MMAERSRLLSAHSPTAPVNRVEDNELMLKARNGSEEAFFDLVGRYKHLMVNHLFRMLGDYELAVDFSQDVFVRVYQNMDRYDGNLKFSTWIYKIATNIAIDEMRRRKRRPRFTSEFNEEVKGAVDGGPSNPSLVMAADPERRALRKEAQGRIQAAISELDEVQRRIFLLKEVENLPLEEISRITGFKTGTLKSRLFRARQFLKERLKTYVRGVAGS